MSLEDSFTNSSQDLTQNIPRSSRAVLIPSSSRPYRYDYVCIYIYIYHMYTYLYVYIYISYVYISICIYIYIHIKSIYIYVYVYICIYIYISQICVFYLNNILHVIRISHLPNLVMWPTLS